MKLRIPLAPAALLLASITPLQAEVLPGEREIMFEANNGESVPAYEGSLTVPENRDAQGSRAITLKYVRFPATGTAVGNPIVYLAGGPGGSGIQTAKYDRFPLFMAMREFGDVIAFDQRGTGASSDLPRCTSSYEISTSQPTSDENYFQLQRAAFAECLQFWKGEGVDVRGYNTPQSVADLDDLRAHLGAEKIDLWGISYGSHLSLAALKQLDDRIGRVIIAAIEGLDQTIKQPARTDLYFDSLQVAIDEVPELRNKYPDVKALIARVLSQLEKEPMALDLPQRDGSTASFLVQRRDVQRFTAAMIADPRRVFWMLEAYRAFDVGDYAPLAAMLARGVDPKETAIALRPMSVLMDVASGTGEQRKAMIAEQGQEALLGMFVNSSMHLESVDPSLDLGDGFRRAPVSDVPVLVLSGTLDGRTYPQSAEEATAGLTRRQMVSVVNGGHNLFMLSPEVAETMADFMHGENVDGRQIIVDLPTP